MTFGLWPVGLCGLRSDTLDWAELEAWTAELQALEKTSYYLEQALVAMLAARQPCAVAPADLGEPPPDGFQFETAPEGSGRLGQCQQFGLGADLGTVSIL